MITRARCYAAAAGAMIAAIVYAVAVAMAGGVL